MTDSQILTIALAIIFPVTALIYSNSRVSDLGKRMDEKFDGLEKRLAEKIDNAFDHMKMLLELHEERHHKP